MTDDFSENLGNWVEIGWTTGRGKGDVNESGQLQIDVNKSITGSYGFEKTVSDQGEGGKATVEFDFTVVNDENTSIRQNLLLLKGSGGNTLVRIQSVIAKDGNAVFGTSDGGSGGNYVKNTEYQTTVECEYNKSYRIKLVVDMDTDKYDLYVKATDDAKYGDPIIQQRNFCVKTENTFKTLSIELTNPSTAGATYVYDNFVIRKVE